MDNGVIDLGLGNAKYAWQSGLGLARLGRREVQYHRATTLDAASQNCRSSLS